MNLTAALHLHPLPRVAIVGGGGKTTTLFTLARESSSPVIVAATAHMAVEQTTLADQHYVITDPADLTPFANHLPPGVTFFTGPVNSANKTTGLTPAAANGVRELARRWSALLLIEADGSKCLPLKAPADHEPPIPDFVDTVVCVVGLTGLGRPLDENTIHRPERFAALSGLASGDPVTPEAVARVLCAADGGLKNIPAQARRIVLLNQADTSALEADARIIARMLLPVYHTAAITALKMGRVLAVYDRDNL